MPWKKQFDTDEALAKAMNAFWARGYEATSVQDLVACMGINRGSLYATFGDNRQLFIQALRRYDAQHREAWVAALEKRRRRGRRARRPARAPAARGRQGAIAPPPVVSHSKGP